MKLSNKPTSEIKEELEALENEIKLRKKAKRKLGREIKKQKKIKPPRQTVPGKGLDGFMKPEQQEIPVGASGLEEICDIKDQEQLKGILDDDDAGVRIDEANGLEDLTG
ncbi:hypothetical protein KKI24_10420 [bacterium]|nr:hypothetical protein [bacterium]